jgi:phosphopantothenoylcysteine decarboxylase/phosphopantothenate--cysteine ligase
VSQSDVLSQDDFLSWRLPHIQLAKKADFFVIAPASASAIAKLYAGMADDILSAAWLSFSGPKLLVPAMHDEMWRSVSVQKHVGALCREGAFLLPPVYGDLASGDIGYGRFPDLSLISLRISMLKYPALSFLGKKILITVGGTSEPLDTVRVLTNQSTGKLGSYLAWLCQFYQAEVTVITTVPILDPGFKEQIYVQTAKQMQDAVLSYFSDTDILIMAAAVSDFTCDPSPKKLSRSQSLALSLSPTEDILKSVSALKKSHQQVIGFCLQDQNLLDYAREKLRHKKTDFMVANTSDAIGSDYRTFYIVGEDKEYCFENKPVWEAAYHILSQIRL